MKKIALFLEAGKRAFTLIRIEGILKRIQEVSEDIELYIFRSSGARSLDLDYNIGEYNIYCLPDLADFDGIIFDLNSTFQRKRYGYGTEACVYIVDQAKASGKPVISFANKMEGCYFVGIDNYAAMHSLIQHVYEKHKCRRFWFIMGPEDNYENRMREKAIRDYLEEKREACGDELFYNEGFESSCGYHGFLKFLERDGMVPDAVICANDNIAVGVCKAAEAKGYHVPEDFLLTGFDNFDKASYFDPRLTTVDQRQEQAGRECIDLFLRIWKGEKVEEEHYIQTESIFQDSCRCLPAAGADLKLYAKRAIYSQIEWEETEDEIKKLEYELLHCENTGQMYETILKGVPTMDCQAMCLVLDNNMDNFQNRTDFYQTGGRSLTGYEKFHINGYPNNMKYVGWKRTGMEEPVESGRTAGLFPLFEPKEGGSGYLFLPLHFGKYSVGYLVIEGVLQVMKKGNLGHLMSTIMMAMENLHKNEKLKYSNERLAEQSVKDAMTGCYNRLGYQQVAWQMFEEKRTAGENLTVLFIDMDHLKYLNDTFGHEWGDTAIQIVSASIMHYCPEGAVPVRMGGDEFLLLMEKMPEEEISGTVEKIRIRLKEQSEKHKMPCQLSVSAGWVNTDMGSDLGLDDYVREADAAMYRDKISGQKKRGKDQPCECIIK